MLLDEGGENGSNPLEHLVDRSLKNIIMAFKCYGSTAVSKTVSRGSTPWRVAKILKGDEA